MKLNITRPAQVEAKILSIYMKVSDSFSATLLDEKNELLAVQEDGYVPEFMPQHSLREGDDSHYGDYLILDIDVDSGQILNWKKPDPEQLEKFIKANELY